MSGIKHLFVSPKADGIDPTIVRPSNWNADHTITGDTTWGGFKITNVGAAAALGDVLSWGRAAEVTALNVTGALTVGGVVPAFTKTGTGPVLTAAGSIILIGGMILKFGYVAAPGTAGASVVFPVAFPNEILTCWGTAMESGSASFLVSAYPNSAAGMSIYTDHAAPFQIAWFAIGR